MNDSLIDGVMYLVKVKSDIIGEIQLHPFRGGKLIYQSNILICMCLISIDGKYKLKSIDGTDIDLDNVESFVSLDEVDKIFFGGV